MTSRCIGVDSGYLLDVGLVGLVSQERDRFSEVSGPSPFQPGTIARAIPPGTFLKKYFSTDVLGLDTPFPPVLK